METFRAGGLIGEAQGRGHVLVCLHGLGGGAYCFRGLGQRLRDNFRVLAFDLPGTGLNRGPAYPVFTVRGCVETLLSLLAGYPAGTVSVLGHSLGTIIALLANAAAPGRMRSLVFAGGLPQVTDMIRQRLTLRAERIRKLGMSGLGAEAAPGVFSEASLASLPETVSLFAALLDAYPASVYLQCLQELLQADARKALASVQTPWLAITGSEDAYAPPDQVLRFAQALPGPLAYSQLPACGHLPFWECPDKFAATIAHSLNHSSLLSNF